MKKAAVVLAAGASRRLGQPKQLLRCGDETLLERTVNICVSAGCEPVVVVLGGAASAIVEQTRLDSSIVINPDWEEGIASSIRTGIRSLADDVDGCILLTCDMPAVTAHHLSLLSNAGSLRASAYAGRCGIPAYFPRSSFSALLQLRGDRGARELLYGAETVDLPGGEFDIDTPEDLARFFGSKD